MTRFLENADLLLKQSEQALITLPLKLDFVDDFYGALYFCAGVLGCTDFSKRTLTKFFADRVLSRDIFRLF